MITNLTVQPHWAKNQLVLNWTTDFTPEPDHRVVVLSSLDAKTWVNVTTQGQLSTTTNTFIHEQPLSNRSSQELYYRIIIQSGSVRYDSPSVNALQVLKPHEFGIIRQILANELLNMQVGDGIEVQLLKPLTFGQYVESYDPATGQQLSANVDDTGFGEKYVNGYFPPFTTWITLVEQRDVEQNNAQGLKTDRSTTVNARGFCFPRPVKNDLLISPQTDERWVVGAVNTHRFKGVIPLMCDLELNLLPRGDIRYKIKPNELPNPYSIL